MTTILHALLKRKDKVALFFAGGAAFILTSAFMQSWAFAQQLPVAGVNSPTALSMAVVFDFKTQNVLMEKNVCACT